MKLQSIFLRRITRTETVYDLVMECYRILDENITNMTGFISGYADMGEEACRSNPNRILLKQFAEDMMTLFAEYSFAGYETRKKEISRAIRALKLSDYGEEELNWLTVPFTLLTALDAVAANWHPESICRTMGPLNGRQQEYLVYFNLGRTVCGDYLETFGKKRRLESGLKDILRTFNVVERRNLAKNSAAPRKIYCPDSGQYGAQSNAVRKYDVRIALLPEVPEGICRPVRTQGSRYVMKYVEERQQESADYILTEMENAIRAGAEFIVLPEYAVSDFTLRQIKQKLEEWYLNDTFPDGRLKVVFAGSTWTEEDDNIQFVLDGQGKVMGKYYKFSPFTKTVRRPGGDVYEIVEGLRHPGGECCAIAVEGTGTFLPAICRDVIDGKYTERLVRELLPAFVVTVAWSASSSSFVGDLKGYARSYFTSSVFCNARAAMDSRARIEFGVSIPIKESTNVTGYFEPCERQREDIARSYMISLDFTPQLRGDRKRISIIPLIKGE